jgi:hypothetical protein
MVHNPFDHPATHDYARILTIGGSGQRSWPPSSTGDLHEKATALRIFNPQF